MPLETGARLGPYQIVSPLGAGAMGEVYRATHVKLRRDVALKVLPAQFAADPDRYAPAYGGFCAFAVSEGYIAPIDPEAWRIVDGRLFLNYDQAIKRLWERDIPGRIAHADANWPRLSVQ